MEWFTATGWIRSACDSALSFGFTPLSQNLIHQNRLRPWLHKQVLVQEVKESCMLSYCWVRDWSEVVFHSPVTNTLLWHLTPPLSFVPSPVSAPPLLRILCVVEFYLVVCSTCQLLRAALDMCVCALHVGFYTFCRTHRTDTLYMQQVGGAHVVIFSLISSSERSAQITQTRPSV